MAILIASTLLETETEAWYSFYVDTMEDVKGLPTSKSTGSSYKVKKFAKPASQAYCIEMAAQYVLDGADEWRLLYAIRDDVADAILKNVEEIKRLVANTSASEQAAAQSASAANASAIAASKSERISTENASSAAASERASRDSAADARTSEGNALNYMNRTADIANQVAGSAASINFAFGPDVFAAQGRVGVGKVPHGLTPSPCPGWRPTAGPERRCGPWRPFPGSATPLRPGG